MAKKKEKTAVKVYEVLIACGNSETGATFEPGETVTLCDFSQAIIDNWLSIEPPVLRERN